MNQSSYTFFFLDTETTGNKTEDRLCQLSFKKQNQPLDEIFDKLYTPPIPISFESMSIHHITTKMVEGCPQFKEAPEYTELKTIFEDKQNILIAHNAPFDVGMLQKELINPASVIDTLKLVRTLDPNMALEKHNLQFLRYKLGLNELITEKIQAHDAKSDVIVLELLFNRLFAKFSELHVGKTIDEILEIMMKISSEPMLISKITFGKHANKFIKDVFKEDRGYLEWLLKSKKDSETEDKRKGGSK